MKLLVLAGLAAPLVLTSPVSVSALPVGAGSPPATVFPSYHSHASQKRNAILAVREERLNIQAADGGKLTNEHRAYLQAKLNAVLHGNY